MNIRRKALREKRHRPLKKGRVIRRLVLCGLLLATLPWVLDWPAFTDRTAFRQLERTALLSPSEIVLRVGNAFLAEGEDWVTVGKVEEYGSNWKPLQNRMPYLTNVAPKGGLVVVALPEVEDDTLTVAVTGLPDEAASGTLSLTVSGVDDHGDTRPMEAEETFTAAALRQGAWMFFRLEAHDHGENAVCILKKLWWELGLGRGVAQYPYTLELRDGCGESISLVSAVLPPDQRFLSGRFTS